MLPLNKQQRMYLKNVAQEAEAELVTLTGMTNAQYNRLKPILDDTTPPRRFTKHNLLSHIRNRYQGVVWNITSIHSFYEQAVALTITTGGKHEVDHIIPLKSDTVSGLFNHHNLQIITQNDNRVKYNSFTPFVKEYNNTAEYMKDNGIPTVEEEAALALKAILP